MQRTTTIPFAFGELTIGLNIKPPKNRDRCRCLDAAWSELIALTADAGQHINAHAGIETLEQPLVVKKKSTFTRGGLTFTITAKATSHLDVNEADILEALGTEIFDLEDSVSDAFFEARDGGGAHIGLIVIEDGAALFDLVEHLGGDTVTQMLATAFGGTKLRDAFTADIMANRLPFPLSDLMDGAIAMRDRFTRRETERQKGQGYDVHQPVRTEPRMATTRRASAGTEHLMDETFADVAVMYGITVDQLKGCITGAAYKGDDPIIEAAKSRCQVDDITEMTGAQTRELIEQVGDGFVERVAVFRSPQSRRDFETKSPYQAMTDLYVGFGFTDSTEFTTTVIALALMSHGGEFVSEFLERNKVHPRQMNASVLNHLIEEAQIGTLLQDVAALAYGLAKV